MALSKDDLLKPRNKVIGPYPEMERHNVKVGDILTEGTRYETTRNQNGDAVFTFEWETFPNIFRKLEWHEDREPDQMPQYVWYDDTPISAKKKKLKVLKVDEWVKEPDGEIWARVNGDNIGFATMHMPEPATESDYNSQKQTTNG